MSEVPYRVKMVRENLENFPRFNLPPGFSLRRYQAGDEENWFCIEAAADRFNEITRELFERQFGAARSGHRALPEAELSQRQFYLVDPERRAIGTGTAWFDDDFEGERYGRVHWVGIVPEYQGRGLGKGLLSAVCHRLRELGHERAYLGTETVRLAAIKLYLRFGFVPLIRSEAEEKLWRPVLEKLK